MKITARQCKTARSLLKWNLHDLVSRTRIYLKRIDSFEKAMCHLQKWENDDLVDVFKKAGVEFLDNFEVVLHHRHADNMVAMEGAAVVAAQGSGQTIQVTAEELGGLTDEEKIPALTLVEELTNPRQDKKKPGK